MLNHAFQRSLQTAERENLQHQLYILLGAAEPTKTGLALPSTLIEPKYSSVNSGLIAWVVNKNGKIQWRSESSELIPLEKIPLIQTQFNPGRNQYFSVWIDHLEYYAVTYDTLWDINKKSRGFRFIILQSREPVLNEIKAYQKRLWRWVMGLALLLLIVQTLIAKWGLSPLRRLADDLEKIEQGLKNQLDGRYPTDIQPVTDNLNRVLKAEQSQRERYRNTLSDLAHSLKTPLAVIRGHLETSSAGSSSPTLQTIEEQVDRMASIVDHQLRRASAQVIQANTQNAVNIRPVIERLCKAMSKVYPSKHIVCKITAEDHLIFHGDEADLMELLGNLIDNAFKYGHHHVDIHARLQSRKMFFEIEDDGLGITQEMQHHILTRGTRADIAIPGQGIGLAVAVDILSSYGGTIELFKSKLGGAGFRITLPA